VVTECDRDASRLALQHMQAIIHGISPAVQTDRNRRIEIPIAAFIDHCSKN
jgi:hypothetical protein